MKNNKNESQVSNNKNKGKKANCNVRPFMYTAFKHYGDSNKKKRKRNSKHYYSFAVLHNAHKW